MFVLLLLFSSIHLYSANLKVLYDVACRQELIIDAAALQDLGRSFVSAPLRTPDNPNEWLNPALNKMIAQLESMISEKDRPSREKIASLSYIKFMERSHESNYTLVMKAFFGGEDSILEVELDVLTHTLSFSEYLNSSDLIFKKIEAEGREETDGAQEYKACFSVPADYKGCVSLDMMCAMPLESFSERFSKFSQNFLEGFLKKMHCSPQFLGTKESMISMRCYEEMALRFWFEKSEFLSNHLATLHLYGVDVDPGDSFDQIIVFDEKYRKWRIILPTREQMMKDLVSCGGGVTTFSVCKKALDLLVEIKIPSIGDKFFNSANVIENFLQAMGMEHAIERLGDHKGGEKERLSVRETLFLFWKNIQKKKGELKTHGASEARMSIKDACHSRQTNDVEPPVLLDVEDQERIDALLQEKRKRMREKRIYEERVYEERMREKRIYEERVYEERMRERRMHEESAKEEKVREERRQRRRQEQSDAIRAKLETRVRWI